MKTDMQVNSSNHSTLKADKMKKLVKIDNTKNKIKTKRKSQKFIKPKPKVLLSLAELKETLKQDVVKSLSTVPAAHTPNNKKRKSDDATDDDQQPGAKKRQVQHEEEDVVKQLKQAYEDTNVIISGINYNTTHETLWQHISKFGEVRHLRMCASVLNNRDNNNGYARVTFEHKEAAERACKHFIEIDGRKLSVCPVEPKETRRNAAPVTAAVVKPAKQGKQGKQQLTEEEEKKEEEGEEEKEKKKKKKKKKKEEEKVEEEEESAEAKPAATTATSPQPLLQRMQSLPNQVFVSGLNFVTVLNDVKEHFSKYGKLVRTSLPRRNDRTANKGICFVSFKEEKSMNKAIADTHGKLDGKVLKVIRYVIRQENERREQRKLFISGVGRSTTTETIRSYFAKYGSVRHVYMPTEADNTSKGFAFVTFVEEQSNYKALDDNHEIDGQNIFVDFGIGRRGEQTKGSCEVEVSGLHFSTTCEGLHKYFSTYGDVNVTMSPQKHNHRFNKGFAWVTFASLQAMMDALGQEHHELDGRKLTLVPKDKTFAQTPAPPPPPQEQEPLGHEVFLRGIDASLRKKDIKKHFSQYGSLLKVALRPPRDGDKPKRFGSVVYKEEEAMREALAHTHTIGGCKVIARRGVSKGVAQTPAPPPEQKPLGHKLFLRGIHAALNEKDIRKHFSHYGSLLTVFLLRPRDGDNAKRFGFVVYEKEGSMREALAHTHTIGGYKVFARRNISKAATEEVFIFGLPTTISEADIRSHFARYGKVASFTLPLQPDGQHKHYAFVAYEHQRCKENVLSDQHTINGHMVYVQLSSKKKTKQETGNTNKLQPEMNRSIRKNMKVEEKNKEEDEQDDEDEENKKEDDEEIEEEEEDEREDKEADEQDEGNEQGESSEEEMDQDHSETDEDVLDENNESEDD